MAEEIKNVENVEQEVKELPEEQLDKVVGGGGKISTPDTVLYTPAQ